MLIRFIWASDVSGKVRGACQSPIRVAFSASASGITSVCWQVIRGSCDRCHQFFQALPHLPKVRITPSVVLQSEPAFVRALTLALR